MTLFSILTWAVVTLSSSFMREAPDYESPLENQLMMGALVETLETDRYWVKVQAEDYTGWVTEYGLKLLEDSEKDEYLKAPKWICTAVATMVREAPSASSAPVREVCMGNLLRKTSQCRGCWTQVLLPDGRTGWLQSSELEDFERLASRRSAPAGGPQALAKQVCDLACSFVGTPYMWGGNTSKYFDCSGLVKFCFFMNGILLPRNASQQLRCGTPVENGEYELGDLLFFGSAKPLKVNHVAIYLGDGRIVQASQAVRIDTLEDYNREVVAATRIAGFTDGSMGASPVLLSPYYSYGKQE